MSDDDTADAPEDDAADAPEEDVADAPEEGESEEISAESLESRLAEVEADLEAAEIEADLDAVEADLEAVETDIEAADLPEPDDEDEEGRREELEGTLSDLRDDLAEQRGPYAEDVVEEIESTKSTISGTEWTAAGVDALVDAVESFARAVDECVENDVPAGVDRPDFQEPSVDGSELDELLETLDDAAAAVTGAGLDPDEDGETIQALLEATDDLRAAVDDAQEWSDLEVRDQLEAQGYFEVLGHHKDYPPEWSALKEWEKRGRADMVLLALEKFDSDFMERHCLDALARMGPEEALDPMLQRAGKRDKDAIRILGTIADDAALDTILEYVDADKDPLLQKATLKALGEIGSEEATQAVANKLYTENERVRSYAARALGLIGDTRAIDPLADVLENDESDSVRASAAWALNQIGTEDARDRVREYADDRAYLVQSEAEKVA